MYCNFCGTETTGAFCPKCGKPITATTSPIAYPVHSPATAAPLPKKKPKLLLIILAAVIILLLIFINFIVGRIKESRLPTMVWNGETYKIGTVTDLKPDYTDDYPYFDIVYLDEDTVLYLDTDTRSGERVIAGFEVWEDSEAVINGLSVGDTRIKAKKIFPNASAVTIDSMTITPSSEYPDLNECTPNFKDQSFDSDYYRLNLYYHSGKQYTEYAFYNLALEQQKLYELFLASSHQLTIVIRDDSVDSISLAETRNRGWFHENYLFGYFDWEEDNFVR